MTPGCMHEEYRTPKGRKIFKIQISSGIQCYYFCTKMIIVLFIQIYDYTKIKLFPTDIKFIVIVRESI